MLTEEIINTAKLHHYANDWYVHFTKSPEDAKRIIAKGIIEPGQDGIVWAIPKNAKYDPNQVETDYDTGEPVTRTNAIVFSAFDSPDGKVKNIVGWKQPVELSTAFMTTVQTGIAVTNHNVEKIQYIQRFDY